jgi:hypothetical protein
MTQSSLSRNIALILFGIVVVLLVTNVVVTKYTNKGEQPKNREALSGIEIDKFFHSALKNFGFSDNWVSKKKIKNVSSDSLFASYSVKCPKDVPIHLLLLELKNTFWENDVTLDAIEIVSGKNTVLKISSENNLKLAVEFYYDENVIREFGTISFLVSDLPLKDDELLNNFLKIPELFYCVLIPNSDSKKHLSALSKAGKRFALMLNDDITELDFKLASNYSDDRLLRSIKEIVGTFYSAAFFIVDEKSDLYESKKYPYIQEQLNKRGIRIIYKSRLETLNSTSINVEDKFQKFMLAIQKKDEKVLLVKSDEFITISTLIPAYRKIGYKFIYPGDIIIKR